MAVINSVEVINDLGLVDEHIRVLITNAVFTSITPDWDITDPDDPGYIANKPNKTSQFTNDGATGKSKYIEWSEVGDINVPSFTVINANNSQTILQLSNTTGKHFIALKSVTINNALTANSTLTISVGNQSQLTQLLSQDDIDVTAENTTYEINGVYPYETGDNLVITIDTTSIIDIDVVVSYT